MPLSFDQSIAQPELVEAVGQALNDESGAVRELALRLLIRIESLNPAHVQPLLRLELVALLKQIERGPTPRARQQSASLLTIFIAGSPVLSTPLARAIGNTLLPRARDDDSSTALSVASALAELIRAAGAKIEPMLDELTEISIGLLADQANADARFVGLRMLSRLASHAERAVAPYAAHPKLLLSIINIVQTDPSPLVRRAAVKAIARLGALDPFELAVVRPAADATTFPVLADASHPLAVGLSHEGL